LQSRFRTYESAICFAQSCRKLILDSDLKDQLNRASASVALNLAEGSAANTTKERHRFYIISLRSFRESEAILRIANITDKDLMKKTNELGAQLYKLCKATTNLSSPRA
jgi:four helix bundle protein